MIEIDEGQFVGKGATRYVYIHPDDPTKILKIYRPGHTPKMIQKRRWFRRLAPTSRFAANRRDLVENTKFRDRHPFLRSNICEVYGYTETSMGPAIIAERVLNEDGQTSHTLREHVKKGMPEDLTEPLKALYKIFGDNHVLLRDEGAGNILVRRKGSEFELVVVDGLGDSNVIKYATWSKFMNRTKLERKLQRLLGRLEKMDKKRKNKAKP